MRIFDQRGWMAACFGVVLLAASANMIFRTLLSGTAMPGMGDDMLHYYYPSYIAIYSQLADGQLPLWNPYQLCGVPWLASMQAGIFYPPHIVFFFLEPWLALVVLAIFHVALGALATMVLARRCGLLFGPAMLAGILFGARGFFPGTVMITNVFEVTSWLPVGGLFVYTLVRRNDIRAGIAGLGFSTGMCLLPGFPQASVYLVYFWGALLLGGLAITRAAPRDWLRTLGSFLAAVALGAALAGVMLLPAAELSRDGSKDLHALSQEEMFPIADGSHVTPFMAMNRFIGAMGMALLPAAVLLGRRKALGALFLGLGLLTLSFSQGRGSPLFDLYLAIPVLDSFRFPSRIKLVTHFCLAFAAAIGLDGLLRNLDAERAQGEGRAKRASALLWGRRIAAACFAMLVMNKYAISARTADQAVFPLSVALLVLLGPLLAGRALSTRLPNPLKFVLVAGSVLGMVGTEILMSPPMKGRIFFMSERERAVYDTPTEITDFLSSRSERVWIHSPGLVPFYPLKLASVYRFRGISDYEPATLRRQAEYFVYLMKGERAFERQRIPYAGGVTLASERSDSRALTERRRLLDLTAARYLLADNDLSRNKMLQAYVEEIGHRVVMRGKYGTLLENPRALPRAFTTYRVESAPPTRELLARLSRDEFDPLISSYVEGDPGFQPDPAAPARGAPARIVVDELNRVVVEAALAAPGMIVLADTFQSGWRATLDDEDEIAIYPVNHLFRGVVVPAGRHRVRFEYRPRSVTLGFASTGLGLVVCGGLAWWRRGSREGSGLPRGETGW